MNVFLTGANGFIGSCLYRFLSKKNYRISCTVRSGSLSGHEIRVGEVDSDTRWDAYLPGVDAVIHLCARVHIMNDRSVSSLSEFRHVNVGGTLNLARQAAAAGVKRFIFISSIKVNGEQTDPNQPLTENSPPSPTDPYSISKYEAEQGLWEISRETGMDVVIIRPPLVYGPGVKANFLRMMQWLERGIPLPLGGIKNKRSLVALDNLVDFICTCVEHPAAANQLFLVSDDHDLSTPALLHSLAGFMRTPDRVFSIPSPLLDMTARLLGKSNEIQRLCGSLQVDITKAKELLAWKPPVSVDHALKETAEWYVESKRVGTGL